MLHHFSDVVRRLCKAENLKFPTENFTHDFIEKEFVVTESADTRTQMNLILNKNYNYTNPIFTIQIKGSVNHEAGKIRKTYFLNFNMAFV